MNPPGAPPPVYCPDFALLPIGEHTGKPRIPFARPVNLITSAARSSEAGAAAPGARLIVLNTDGRLYIRDLTGDYQMHWNGRLVTEATVAHGDRLRLANVEHEVSAPNCMPAAAADHPPAE